MKNNKGVSAVIATVLIILITIAAVTIIWAIIIPMVQNLMTSGTVCMDVMKDIEIGDRTCFNSTGNNISVQVTRSPGDYNIENLYIAIEDTVGNTNTTRINSTSQTTSAIYKGHPEQNGARVYIFNRTATLGTNLPQRVSVAASVVKDGKLSECATTAPKKIFECK